MSWYDPRTWFAPAKGDGKRSIPFKGARKSHRNSTWFAPGSSSNAALARSLVTLRNRSRDLKRNNRYQRHALMQLASYFSGLTPKSAIKAKGGASDAQRERVRKLNARIDEVFAAWAKQCHGEGDLTFSGLQTQAVLGMLEGGDTFTRKRVRRLEDGLAVPLQLEVLEADFVDHNANEKLTSHGKKGGETLVGWIRQGVRFDAVGRRTGYHVYPEHPGDALVGLSLAKTVIVPAASVAHLYDAVFARPGQVRGAPWNHAILQDMQDFDGYMEAERVRLYGSASVMGVVESDEEVSFDDDEDDDLPSGLNPARDSNGDVVEKLRAGQVVYLSKGQVWKTQAPPMSDAFDKYVKTDLRGQAAGAGMPYELYSGDLSDANFSSLMAAMGPFLRIATTVQDEIVAPLWGEKIWGWFVEIGQAAGVLPREAGPVTWQRKPWPMVDPVKQTNASKAQVRSGAKSLATWQRELGGEPEQVRDEIEREAAWATEAGVVLDSLPTTATLSGQRQDPAEDPDDEIGDGEVDAAEEVE